MMTIVGLAWVEDLFEALRKSRDFWEVENERSRDSGPRRSGKTL